MIDTLLEALALKQLDRAGWLRVGVARPESVAAHSWGVAWLVLALCPEGLDRGRALTYAILHDLPEVRVGDITPADAVAPEAKAAREHAAIVGLGRELPEIRALWEAYERQADPEARLVKQLDRLDMALQAVAYAEQGHRGMDEFLASAARCIDDPELVAILDQLRQRLQRAGEP